MITYDEFIAHNCGGTCPCDQCIEYRKETQRLADQMEEADGREA